MFKKTASNVDVPIVDAPSEDALVAALDRLSAEIRARHAKIVDTRPTPPPAHTPRFLVRLYGDAPDFGLVCGQCVVLREDQVAELEARTVVVKGRGRPLVERLDSDETAAVSPAPPAPPEPTVYVRWLVSHRNSHTQMVHAAGEISELPQSLWRAMTRPVRFGAPAGLFVGTGNGVIAVGAEELTPDEIAALPKPAPPPKVDRTALLSSAFALVDAAKKCGFLSEHPGVCA